MKRILSLIILSTVLIGCNSTNKDLGSGKNPIKFYLMPRMESTIMDESAEVLADFLENDTGFTVEVVVAKDYIDIVNFISEKKADVALLNTLGYILAHDWSGAEANLKVLYGDRQATYKGALLVQTNSNINSVRDLNGKKVAFTTPYSTSGYLLPTKTFHDKKIKPSKTIFAGSYAQAMDMLYNGQVDAAVSYYNSIGKNEYEDARNLINDKYPDANKKLRILTLTGEIPSGPIVFRRNLPENVKPK
ncbi:phosphate/phosphite/phosphonate ABC transporter substrate-binding protein [bacterium]|nr:phosphate/phosphite/phosphonate ABC transporter substrate-binding protein [bacterium]